MHTPHINWLPLALTCLWSLSFGLAASAADSTSVGEALKYSQASGKPVLAVAGPDSCANCKALMHRLATDNSVQPLVAHFVVLKIDTESAAWRQWTKKYKAGGGGATPIVFVVRADGKLMHRQSGAISGDALRKFLADQLASAGNSLTDQQLAELEKIVATGKESISAGDYAAAVKVVAPLQSLPTPGKLNSLATSAVAAENLYAELVQQGQNDLKIAQDKLTAGEQFPGVIGILAANRIYGSFPELRTELATAQRDLMKQTELKDVVTQAEAVDKALAVAIQKSSVAQKSAVTLLERIVQRFPGTPAAEIAQAKLIELGQEVPKTTPQATSLPTGLRTWTDVTGSFKVEAEAVSVDDGKVALKKADGTIIKVPLDMLSPADRRLLNRDE